MRKALLVAGGLTLIPVLASCQTIDTPGAPVFRTVLGDHTGTVTTVTVAPGGDWVVSGEDNIVTIWDLSSGEERTRLSGQDDVISVAITPDGSTIVSQERETTRLWDVATETEIGRFTTGGGSNMGRVLSRDGATLLFNDGTSVTLRDLATGAEKSFRRPNRRNALAAWGLARHGRTLVATIYAVEIILWDTETGEERLIIPNENVLSVALSPDDRMLATGPGSDGGPVKLRSMNSGQLLAALPGHTARVWQVAFSPDGTMLASAGWDGAVRLWDVAAGELLATLRGLPRFYSVAFSPDGGTLVAGGRAPTDGLGNILVWQLSRGRP